MLADSPLNLDPAATSPHGPAVGGGGRWSVSLRTPLEPFEQMLACDSPTEVIEWQEVDSFGLDG